jgi:hypothetical protein
LYTLESELFSAFNPYAVQPIEHAAWATSHRSAMSKVAASEKISVVPRRFIDCSSQMGVSHLK